MDRSNRNRGQSSRGRGGHDRGSRGNFSSTRGAYSNRGGTALSRGSRGSYIGSGHSSGRESYSSVNQGGRSGYSGTNALNSMNNNGAVTGRERASRWGDSNNSQVTPHQSSQHQPAFVSQPPVQIPNMNNPPPGYPSNYGYQSQQHFRGGF